MRSIGITSCGSSTTQITERSRRSSAQIRHRGPSARLKQISQRPTLLLDLADRVGERQRVLVGGAQDVEGEPLGGPPADPRQLRRARRSAAGSAGRTSWPTSPAGRGRPAAEPPVTPPIFDSARSCAARIPSLTAASTMSWSISTSSGSIASGSIVSSSSRRSPLILTLTMPPPALASTISSLSFSCASAMSACICWTCFIIAFRSMPAGPPPLPVLRVVMRLASSLSVRRSIDLLGVELALELLDELVVGLSSLARPPRRPRSSSSST